MKKILVLILLAGLSACNQEPAEPWKSATIDYLKNPEHLNDVAMYEPMEFELPDTLSGDTAYVVEHLYKGLNIASREVRRKARVYFNLDWKVLGYENIDYLDPMTKAQRKGRKDGEQ